MENKNKKALKTFLALSAISAGMNSQNPHLVQRKKTKGQKEIIPTGTQKFYVSKLIDGNFVPQGYIVAISLKSATKKASKGGLIIDHQKTNLERNGE